jgi:allophanate hydrolase subunit 2
MGARIESRDGGLMISEGTPLGAIQLPDEGEPIILLSDRPTTGGYPMIACVIGADIATVGQLAPGAPLRFEEVSIESARTAWRDQQSELDRLFKPHANIGAKG